MTSTAPTSASGITPARLRLLIAASGCGLFASFATTVYVIYFSRHFAHDWMVYYTAARACLDGNLPLIFDGDRFTAQINLAFAERLAEPLSFHPWLYPPPFLLLVIPFGMMPFALGCALFLLASFGLLLLALWCTFASHRWLYAMSVLLAPATGFTIGSGQNAFLTSAMMVGGFGLLARRPRLAGVLLGLVTFKPQFWLLVPVALVAARHYSALAIAIVTAAALACLSLAVLGIEPWQVWIEWMIIPPADAYREWLIAGRLQGESLYTNLVLLGAPNALANAGQIAALALGGGCVWWCYSRPVQADLRLAVLLIATTLAAPHLGPYDAVLLAIAATILFVRGNAEGFRLGEMPVAMLVWMIQLFNPPSAFRIGLITPFLTAALIVYAMLRASADAGLGRTVQGVPPLVPSRDAEPVA